MKFYGIPINASQQTIARIKNEFVYHDRSRAILAAKIEAITGVSPRFDAPQPSVMSGQEWQAAQDAFVQAVSDGLALLTIADDGTVSGVGYVDGLAAWGGFAEHVAI
jgi:hypothetical protein